VTVPNLLSLLRMGLTPLFVVAVVNGQPLHALLVFGLAGITDALDGFIARAYRQQTRLGALLDPIADKLLLMSAYVVLTIPGLHPGTTIPIWVTVLVIARDLIIVIVALTFFLALDFSGFRPSWLSKLNTSVQVVTAILVLASGVWQTLREIAEWSIYAAALTTFSSGLAYIFRTSRMAVDDRKPPPPPEPEEWTRKV
jgi:cardiolipin synthase (CMP-forming)